jgi:hypothetical protein
MAQCFSLLLACIMGLPLLMLENMVIIGLPLAIFIQAISIITIMRAISTSFHPFIVALVADPMANQCVSLKTTLTDDS